MPPNPDHHRRDPRDLDDLPPPGGEYSPPRKKPRKATHLPPLPGKPPPAPMPAEEVRFPGQYTEADAGSLVPSAQLAEIQRLLVEVARREVESLNLYEPLPEQERFHRSTCRQRLLRGSNRGGKTLPAAVEVARAVLGRDPWNKYPAVDGRCFCVGKDLAHVGEVMWRKLGRAGAFKIIRDEVSGAWRAFRPGEPSDQARKHEAKKAPPLIPPRMIKSIAWENKAKGIPKKVILHNGWELNLYSSESKPPQGSDIDLWWFDEEIVDEDWQPEMVARVLDRAGRGIWSATPQAGTDRLFDLHETAEQEEAEGVILRSVEEFIILLRNNPHIDEDQKRAFAKSLSEEEQRVRIGGEFVLSRQKIFPEFRMETHGVPAFAIPPEWTRYAVIDPGHQVCAVLFGAVPPTDEGDHCYLYEELYIPNCSAELFGQKMAQRAQGQRFEAFLIDHHGGQLTEIGSGLSVEKQYSRALRKYRVASVKTGYEFVWACDDVEGTLEAVRSWLRIREDGTTKLRVLSDKLPNFEWEIKRYRFKKVKGDMTDKPEERGRVHLMACLRYIAAYRPRHVPGMHGKRRLSGAIAAFREKQKHKRSKGTDGAPLVSLGPVGGLGKP